MFSGAKLTNRGHLVGRLITAIGGALLASSTPAVALERRPVPPAGTALSETVPPWDRPGGSTQSPPRPPRRPMPPHERGVAHPALHGRRLPERAPVVRLFPRAAAPVLDERHAAMARHPAGKSLSRTTYRVRSGDSLWEIAASRVGPNEVSRCAGALYRENSEVVGPNEDLILPDQMLTIPGDCRG